MDEPQFREKLYKILKDNLPRYQVETGKSTLYKAIVDFDGKYDPEDPKNPKRGQYAFQTDILISNKKVPLVVIETKFGDFSTHDVITYSTKAVKHKEVYPYLRYGFIVGGKVKIERKFFVHNTGFDFAIATEISDEDLNNIVEVVREQVKSAELLLDILKDKPARKYVTKMQVEWAFEK